MDNLYKAEIINLLENPSWSGFFKVPSSGAREYPLTSQDGNSCRADFCYELRPTGKVFIEDDEAPTALNNLVKYWRWCLHHPEEHPVHLVHIIGADSGAGIEHCKFLESRMKKELAGNTFQYHIMTVSGQWSAHEKWLPRLKEVLSEIAGIKETHPKP